jgi:predicted nucleic acid-binding protein
VTDQAVSDTGPLRHLAEIGEHPLLTLFSRIIVPRLVVRELQAQGFWSTLVEDLRQLIVVSGPSLDAESVLHRPRGLDAADAAVLLVATQYPNHLVLTDDLAVRRAAKSRGCRVVGTIGLIGRGYEVGALSLPQAEAMLDRVVDESTLYLTEGVVEQVREAMKRIPPQ